MTMQKGSKVRVEEDAEAEASSRKKARPNS